MFISIANAGINIPVIDSGEKRLFSSDNIKTIIGGNIKNNKQNIFVEALKNINLEIKSGDRVGIIGVNGAGKSTLLRLIAGIYVPTYGTIRTKGKITPILDNDLGMDPNATGYENIEIGCIFSGLPLEQIKILKPKIAEFTELREFLDVPIRTYSSGMTSRLSFAIATATKCEILLLDEGIGAGDKDFHEKAQKRLNSFLENSGILVLASHNLEMLKSYCNKGLYLDKGEVVAFGKIGNIIKKYMNA